MKATTGYLVIRSNEISIMNTADVNTAKEIWRWNMNGFGYSNTGINGKYETAITMDGAIVADFITAGVLSANLIKAGTMNLARLFGGDLMLGGNNNISGRLIIKDKNAVEKMIADAEGLRLINGAKLFGSDGVLSGFQYYAVSAINDFLGFYDTSETNIKTQLQINAYIPENFVIREAKVTLVHNPVKWSSRAVSKSFWGYCRNLKLYKITNQNYQREAFIGSFYTENLNESYLLNTNALNFTANAATDSSHNQQITTSTDIKNYLQSGNNMLVIQTANSIPTHKGDFIEEDANKQTAQASAFLTITGYMK